MSDPLDALIQCLRHELQQYGEMLARLDQQQESIVRRAADELLVSVAAVQEQAVLLQEARQARRLSQRRLAASLHLPEDANLAQLFGNVPPEYRPLVRALTDENRSLFVRVQQRARQNQLLLHRSLELMQNLLQTLFPMGNGQLYDESGRSSGDDLPACATYEAVG